MKRYERTNLNAALPAERGTPTTDLSELPPWDQVRILSRMHSRRCPTTPAYPQVQLRGDKIYLRALRAAELTAWESPSARAETPARFEFASQI